MSTLRSDGQTRFSRRARRAAADCVTNVIPSKPPDFSFHCVINQPTHLSLAPPHGLNSFATDTQVAVVDNRNICFAMPSFAGAFALFLSFSQVGAFAPNSLFALRVPTVQVSLISSTGF
jgi:hypothetical protein